MAEKNRKILYRGPKASLPTLPQGVFGYCTDTDEIFIGDGADNHQVTMYDLFDANTILKADTDNAPEAMAVAEATIVGRLTGGSIAALTASQVKTLLAITASDVSVVDSSNYFNGSNVEDVLEEIGETTWTNGFDLQTPDSNGTISWDDATRTFSIAVKSGQSSFYFWTNGKKITKTSTQSVVVPDTTGTYYMYFNDAGTLSYIAEASVPDAAFYEYAIVGLVYWNKTAATGMCGNERHGVRMSGSTHRYNHETFGARYEEGLNIEGLSSGGTTYTQTTSGYFWDEDIRHSIDAQSTHKFLYRLGADGEWTGLAADNKVSYNAGGSYDVWNEWTGSTWQLTEGTYSTDYWIVFYIATPNIGTTTIFKVIGQNAYSSRTNARNAIESEMNSLKTDGLPSPEIVFLYATIVKRDGKLQALADGGLYLDLRSYKGGSSGDSAAAKYADDVITDTTNFAGNLSTADTDVQKALDTLDDVPHYIEYRLLDKDTDQSADTGVGGDFRVPQAMTVLGVGAYCDTAPSGAGTTVDINEAGSSILSTKITLDDGEKSSETAATAPVVSDSAIAADAIITFDVDGVGGTTAGKGLVVWMKVSF